MKEGGGWRNEVHWKENHTLTYWINKVNCPTDNIQYTFFCLIIKPKQDSMWLYSSYILFQSNNGRWEFQRIVKKYMLISMYSKCNINIYNKNSVLISHSFAHVTLLFLYWTDGLVVIGHRWGFRGNIKHPTQCYICPSFDSHAKMNSKVYCLLLS